MPAQAAVAAHQGPAAKASRSGIAAITANRGHHALGSAAERIVSPSRESSAPPAIAEAVSHTAAPAATWATEAQAVTATSSRSRERFRADHRRVIRPSSSASGVVTRQSPGDVAPAPPRRPAPSRTPDT